MPIHDASFSRHEWCAPDEEYEVLHDLCERNVGTGDGDLLDYWQDYHAQTGNGGEDILPSSRTPVRGMPFAEFAAWRKAHRLTRRCLRPSLSLESRLQAAKCGNGKVHEIIPIA